MRAKTTKKILLLLAALAAGPAAAFEDARQDAAVELMRRCEAALWEERAKRVPGFDARADPDRTGLIGAEFSALATTPGSWHDKRASVRPEMAGAVAGYLLRAGVAEGDWIGINSSSSYPGFTVASLCAARALKLNTVFVLSYGASMYGGTLTDFTIPVMLDALRERGLLDAKIDVLTPGGDGDRIPRGIMGGDVLPLVRRLMSARAETCLVPDGARTSMEFRRMLFFARPLRAFINCGGPESSMGGDQAAALALPHGLIVPPYAVPPAAWNRGLIMDFLEKGVPCVHLLFTGGVCRDWGLPYGTGPEPDFWNRDEEAPSVGK